MPDNANSLDPADWEAFRELCHRAVDDSVDFLKGVRDRPVWRPVPEATKTALSTTAPIEGAPLEVVYDRFLEHVRAYPTGNIHPRFFGWVHGTGTAGGALAEFLAATMNANVGGRDHAAVYVERQVIGWFRDIFGFPAEASGVLVSGTSMATLLALTIARNQALAGDVRLRGVGGDGATLRLYTSAEAHNSVAKAAEVLGLGRERLRAVPADASGRMDMQALAAAIVADKEAGLKPFCVVATAGAVNTGASDDLVAIADLCAANGLWMHVDGAFGALAILSPEHRHLVNGVEQADSLAFDFHKWLHVPYDAGCLLVRDGEKHFSTFASNPNYLAKAEAGLAGGTPWFNDFGVELSRGFRALKVWFTIQEHGLARLGEKIADNCAHARRLAELVDVDPALERLAPVALNIVCFRAVPPGLEGGAIDSLNAAIVPWLHEEGVVAPSLTKVGGRSAIRVNITNHRTQAEDMNILVEAVHRAVARLRA